MRIVVTGGAGFIGSALVRHYLATTSHTIVNIDKLTYAANLDSLRVAQDNPNYHFEKIDICNKKDVEQAFHAYSPDCIMHLAAESHVDRSIDGPNEFILTNVIGTQVLLDVALDYWRHLDGEKKAAFRFHHVSTDEVFGSLTEGLFVETSPYDPSSPYAASKASSDHLVRAWGATYGLPVVLSNTSNNYGPYQFPEKLIPLMILKAVAGQPLPVYGTGANVRDWLYVEDHVRGLQKVLERGTVGSSYNIGAYNERTNLQVVEAICDIIDELMPLDSGPRRGLIEFVQDRPGHDFRYAIDAAKIRRELGWIPEETFESGMRKTVEWYLDNGDWVAAAKNSYAGERLGVSGWFGLGIRPMNDERTA